MPIRPFKIEEKEAFIRLDSAAFPGDEYPEGAFEKNIKRDGFLGLFLDSKLAGYLDLRIMGSYGHLGRIAVHKDFRGQGYGSKLMNYSVEYFLEHGVEKAGIYVETKNKPAIELYKKHGFEIIFQSWHYILQAASHNMIRNEGLEILPASEDDVEEIMNSFPYLNKDQISTYITSPGNNRVFIMKSDHKIVSFLRFNPNFSGCMPFEVENIEVADQVIERILSDELLDDRDYLRLTFDRYDWLANEFDDRGYDLHHHLYKLEREFT